MFDQYEATDADDDTIICKWANKDVEGCGGICNGLPGAKINPVSSRRIFSTPILF